MARFDDSTAKCFVLTYKEGLLSALAHDLRIRVGRFTLDADESAVKAVFDASSLRVETALKDGADAPGTLSAKDIAEIEGNIVNDVLHSKAHPEIVFQSSSVTRARDGYGVSGTLTLHGAAKPVQLVIKRQGDRLVAEHSLHQPDFGVKPFSAMLGTLKIKPDITVRVSVPASSVAG